MADHNAIMRAPSLVFLLILATASAAVLAEPPHWREQRRDERSYRDNYHDDRRNDKRAVRDVVGEVEQNYRGHVVDVQPPRANEEMYRVRVLQEGGRVKTLHVPARRDNARRRER